MCKRQPAQRRPIRAPTRRPHIRGAQSHPRPFVCSSSSRGRSCPGRAGNSHSGCVGSRLPACVTLLNGTLPRTPYTASLLKPHHSGHYKFCSRLCPNNLLRIHSPLVPSKSPQDHRADEGGAVNPNPASLGTTCPLACARLASHCFSSHPLSTCPSTREPFPIGGQAIQQSALSSLFPLALSVSSYFTIRARDAEMAELAALTSAPPAREQKQGHALS